MKTLSELIIFVTLKFEFIAEQFKARDQAREVQAAIYEERLMGLNHEHARLNKQLENSVSPEKFEGGMNQVNAKIDSNTHQINERIIEQGKLIQSLNDWRTGQGGGVEKVLDLREWIRWGVMIAGFILLWIYK